MVKTKQKSPVKHRMEKRLSTNKENNNVEPNVEAKKKKAKMYSSALREIKHLQKTTHLLIPKAPFLRLVRETMMSFANTEYRITEIAVDALREASESYLIGLLEDSYLLALHAKRVTLFPRDIGLALTLRNDFGAKDGL